MLKHELLQRLIVLPDEADLGIRIGDTHLGIDEVVPWQAADGLYDLRCQEADLRDILNEWASSGTIRLRSGLLLLR